MPSLAVNYSLGIHCFSLPNASVATSRAVDSISLIRRIRRRAVLCSRFLGYFDLALLILTLLPLASSESNASLMDSLFSANAGGS